jgi:hypothetical protein
MKAPLQFFCLSAFAVAVLVACEPNNVRQSDKDAIIGKYDWLVNGSSHRGTTHIAYEGYIIDVYESDNLRSAGARVAGFWKVLDKEKRKYLLHWKDPWNEFKDVLVLSEDGNYLKGTNDIGSVIEGKRVLSSTAPSTGPAQESATEREKLKTSHRSPFGFKTEGRLHSFRGSFTNFTVTGIKTEPNLLDTPPRPKDWLYKLWPAP